MWPTLGSRTAEEQNRTDMSPVCDCAREMMSTVLCRSFSNFLGWRGGAMLVHQTYYQEVSCSIPGQDVAVKRLWASCSHPRSTVTKRDKLV